MSVVSPPLWQSIDHVPSVFVVNGYDGYAYLGLGLSNGYCDPRPSEGLRAAYISTAASLGPVAHDVNGREGWVSLGCRNDMVQPVHLCTGIARSVPLCTARSSGSARIVHYTCESAGGCCACLPDVESTAIWVGHLAAS